MTEPHIALRKPYALLPSPSETYNAVAVATGWERPDEYLAELLQEPAAQGAAGVLLDLLLANGTRTRRFFHITAGPRAQRVEPSSAERAMCNRYLGEHADQLDLSLLSPALRYIVREGLLGSAV